MFGGENVVRRAVLTSLDVVFILPNPVNEMGYCAVERTLDRNADTSAFSATMAKLFSTLADISARAAERPPLLLTFSDGWRHSRATEPHGSEECPCERRYDQDQHERQEVMEAVAMSGQFELVDVDSVPVLHGVTTLEFLGFEDLEDLKPNWIANLARKLPDLEKLSIRGSDHYEQGRSKRQAQRKCMYHKAMFSNQLIISTGFLTSVRNLPAQHLRELVLDITHDEIMNESSPVHKIVDEDDWRNESHFGVVCYVATFENLTVLRLLGGLVICPEFFLGIIEQSTIITPFASLVEFELQFAPETADGRWFYQRDNDTIEGSRGNPEFAGFWKEHAIRQTQRETDFDDDDTDSVDSSEHVRIYEDGPMRTDVVPKYRFRSLPDKSTLLPFLLDAAEAVSRLPSIKKFILKQGDCWSSYTHLDYTPVVSRVFEIWYLKAGMHRTPLNTPMIPVPQIPKDASYLNQNRLYWRVDRWKPWDEVQKAWNGIVGPDAKHVNLEEEHLTYYGGNRSLLMYKGEF
jgi:hypothetical protein